jgi:hypothetical protein
MTRKAQLFHSIFKQLIVIGRHLWLNLRANIAQNMANPVGVMYRNVFRHVLNFIDII